MGVKQTLLPDGQPLTVLFTVLALLCGPNANEMEATLFTKNGEGRNFDIFDTQTKGTIFPGCKLIQWLASTGKKLKS